MYPSLLHSDRLVTVLYTSRINYLACVYEAPIINLARQHEYGQLRPVDFAQTLARKGDRGENIVRSRERC